MSDDLKKLNSIIRNIEEKELLTESTQQVNEIGSIAGKLIPGVGLGLGAYDAYKRAKAGDWGGAALSGLGGVASLVPGVGTAASLGLGGYQAARDKARTGSFFPSDEEIAAAANTPQQGTQVAQTSQKAGPTLKMPSTQRGPEVLALQKQLIAKGANIEADGIMGPKTMAALQQFGDKPSTQLASVQYKEKPMTESEKMTELRAKLQQLEEGPLDLAKTVWQGAKWGATHPELTSNLAGKSGVANKLAAGAAKATGAAARNPLKTAALTGAAGFGLGQMGGASADDTDTDTEKRPLTSAEKTELDNLAKELANNTDPEIQELLQQYLEYKGGVGQQIGTAIGSTLKAPSRFAGDVLKGMWNA